jgi:hypothetical protein
MTPARFESALPASERLHTDALDCAATGNGVFQFAILKYKDEGIQNYNFSVLLYWCGTWSCMLREEYRLRVFENRVLRKIFGP